MAPRLVSNPPNPFASALVEWIDAPPQANLIVYEEDAKTIINKNDSPDIGFNFSVNPYRGCFHGCAYCYARPTHQYLDFGAGTDFERKIVAKVNAPAKIRAELAKKSWKNEGIVFSGVTDCYQPLEASYELTRGCLEACLEFKNPVAIITKGALVCRDIDILTGLNREASVRVAISIPFTDDEMARKIEPYAPSPSTRFRALKTLSEAGIKTSVGVAPVIPGLNDSQISGVLERAKDCGATSAFMTLLRLPKEVKTVFTERLTEAYPTRAEKVLNQLRDLKGGVLNRSDFGTRMVGQGPRWEAIKWVFNSNRDRLGL